MAILFKFSRGGYGPPVLVSQTDRTASAPAGSDRALGSPPPSGARMMLIGLPVSPMGPPILVGQVASQVAFATEGNDRRLDSSLPGPQRLLLGGKLAKGPPILVRQKGFATEGNDRTIDAILTHPLLKFKIGAKPGGPPIKVRQIGSPEGNDRFVGDVLTHPLLKFRIGSKRVGPPIKTNQSFPSTGVSFPVQYDGFYIKKDAGSVALCLVATADAPVGMGGQPRFYKGGVTYCIYLVETSDTHASPVRMQTTTGTKAVRLKT